MENLGRRNMDITGMAPEGEGRMRIEGVITARGLIGFKSEFMTLTKGTGLMHHSFHGFVPKKGAPAKRLVGALHFYPHEAIRR